MPWRLTRDPYRIWLSEIMLQQTQVATVIPYYERFVARYPTVRDLAAANVDEVLKLWAGLGYYSRARNLHRGAQTIVERFGGVVPDTPELIREVPGIGPYTAGAILSIAYQKAVPLVDGNVARVFSRLRLIEGDWRTPQTRKTLWALAEELVSVCAAESRQPGDFNQALMELGATICSPRSPQCLICPVNAHCLAYAQSKQELFPQVEKKAEVPRWPLRAWIVRDSRGRLLFAQREPDGLFGGLWEVPTEKIAPKEKKAATLGRVKHVLSHRELDIHICSAEYGKRFSAKSKPEAFECWSGAYVKFKWLTLAEALRGNAIALSSVQKKILAALHTRNSTDRSRKPL